MKMTADQIKALPNGTVGVIETTGQLKLVVVKYSKQWWSCTALPSETNVFGAGKRNAMSAHDLAEYDILLVAQVK